MRGPLLFLLLLGSALAPVVFVHAHPDPEPETPRALVVTWTPAHPRVGDQVEVLIEGKGTWPEPSCEIELLPISDAEAPKMMGMGAMLRGDDYVCSFEVDFDGIVVLTVVDIEAGVYRLHGPHFLVTEGAAREQIERLDRIQLAETLSPDGIVTGTATAPPMLFGGSIPETPLFSTIEITQARVNYMLLPDTRTFGLSHNGPTPYAAPDSIVAQIDVADAYERSGDAALGPEDGFILIAYMTATSHRAIGAFGISDADVEVYGACTREKCLIVDG